MPLFELKGKKPQINPNVVYISPLATIIGEVIIGEGCTIFENVVIDADVAPIYIGNRVNIQSQSVIHTLSDFPTTIGNNVTIGHRAIVHGAHIEDNVIVGIGSIIGSYAQVRKGAVIGEGAVVSQKKEIPARSIAMGMPAKIIKTITEEQEMNAIKIADYYVKSGRNRARYLKEIKI